MKKLNLFLLGIVCCSLIAGAWASDALSTTVQPLLDAERYTEALQQLARLQAFHYHEADQMPSALFYEALIYHKTGANQAKEYVLQELKMSFPGTEWSRRAIELK